MTRLVEELADGYDSATRTDEGQKIMVKLPRVFLPDGCHPGETTVLILLDERQPTPQLFIKQVPTLPNGITPRSVSAVPVAGESWNTFSFNQPWDENVHTAIQFVEGRLRRFALNE